MRLITPFGPGAGAAPTSALGAGSGRIVLFPYAGGSPRSLRHLAAALPQHRVSAVTYPGRDHLLDAAPITDTRALAEVLAAELWDDLRADDPFPAGTGPLLLVGHSLGALVAYETAGALARVEAAHAVSLPQTVLVVSGQNPPLSPVLSAPSTDDEIIADIIRQNPASALAWADPELCAFFLPAVRADYRLLSSYQPSGAVLEEIHVVVAHQDQEVDRALLPRWQQVSRRRVQFTEVVGGHLYLDSPDTQLARVLARIAARLRAPSMGPSPQEARHDA